ncbi:MAG: hypothetical protein HGB17_06645, partial [Syntrophobacteraceae bacterium]|nr:hypothetical protein [Syntrophobacteraceae bacterium]
MKDEDGGVKNLRPLSAADVEPEVSEEELNEILKKVDKEATFRKLSGYQHRIVFWVAVGFSIFQLYTG